MAVLAGKKPQAYTPYPAQRKDAALSLTIECCTKHWLDPFARTEFSLSLKTHGLSKGELADKATAGILYE